MKRSRQTGCTGMETVLRADRRQCKYALVTAVMVVVCVCAGVTMNLTTVYDENFDHMGIRTFCMFTVISNIFAAMAMALTIPFTVEGIRKNNYHVPGWVVDLTFVAVTAVTITLLVSLIILAPVKGFVLIFTGSRFLLHAICPILAIDAFCFFISDHRITVTESFLPLIPVYFYAMLYYVMVVVIGEENGGWNDFYGFATYVNVYIPMALILPLTYAVAAVLRRLHNRLYDLRRQREAVLYEEAMAGKDVRQAIAALGESQGRAARLAVVPVPLRVIALMIRHSGAECSLEEGCGIFLEACLRAGDEPKGRKHRKKREKEEAGTGGAEA